MITQFQKPTTNFIIQYDTACMYGVSRADALYQVIENEFSILKDWFGLDTDDFFGPDNQITVILKNVFYESEYFDEHIGANMSSHIYINCIDDYNSPDDAGMVAMLFVKKIAKVLMLYKIYGGLIGLLSNSEIYRSDIEGLSLFCARERYPDAYDLYFSNHPNVSRTPSGNGPWVSHWLNSTTRIDYISATSDLDVYNPGKVELTAEVFGCNLLFLYYLKSQLNEEVDKIVANWNWNESLAILYLRLTNDADTVGAIKGFKSLVDRFFPVSSTPSPTENPFPLILAGTKRSVSINDVEKTAVPLKPPIRPISVGSTFIQFPGCPTGKVYEYFILPAVQQVAITAESTGFGHSQFTWRVNGQPLLHELGNVEIKDVEVFYDDPSLPGSIKTKIGKNTVTFNYYTSSNSDTAELYIFNVQIQGKFGGHVNLGIEVDASDMYVQRGVSVSDFSSVIIDLESLLWKSDYYSDALNCSKQITPPKTPHFIKPLPVPDLTNLRNYLKEIKSPT
jgi:hypothetical protein